MRACAPARECLVLPAHSDRADSDSAASLLLRFRNNDLGLVTPEETALHVQTNAASNMQALADMLKGNHSLTVLNLANNGIRSSHALCEAAQANRSIRFFG